MDASVDHRMTCNNYDRKQKRNCARLILQISSFLGGHHLYMNFCVYVTWCESRPSVNYFVRYCVPPPLCVSVSSLLCIYYLQPNYPWARHRQNPWMVVVDLGRLWVPSAHLPQPCCDFLLSNLCYPASALRNFASEASNLGSVANKHSAGASWQRPAVGQLISASKWKKVFLEHPSDQPRLINIWSLLVITSYDCSKLVTTNHNHE